MTSYIANPQIGFSIKMKDLTHLFFCVVRSSTIFYLYIQKN